jgi:hypothetical protein
MKKYFLILMGNFESEVCNEIAITVSPLVDSPQLKFQSSQTFILMHFASEVDRQEIYEYLHANLFDKVGSFVLSENNDNMSVFMPEDIKSHLFDLENESSDVVINIDLKKVREYMDIPEPEEDEEDFVALLLDKIKKKVKKPSLDSLLEKIQSEGLNSLTPFEKDTLDEYSKN